MHDALLPLIDQGIMHRMANLCLSPQASHEASRLWLQAASTSRALGDGYTLLSQYTQDLHEELARERLKLGALEQELQELRSQVNNYPWDMALKDQELRRAQAERDAANQAAFIDCQEREGLRRAYLQDSPRRCHRIGVAVQSDSVLNCQDRAPILPTLAVKYKKRYPAG
ncbi:hypothetical protein LIER_13851 [Lithospermum erythrorhizon]|uniref:Uncharacterized protein n=1 Tax=Lithospermum erythrorhizon TaxID=34254 RepID=A0AAV3Q1I6_LITER